MWRSHAVRLAFLVLHLLVLLSALMPRSSERVAKKTKPSDTSRTPDLSDFHATGSSDGAANCEPPGLLCRANSGKAASCAAGHACLDFTGLMLTGLQRSRIMQADHPTVAAGLKHLSGMAQPDGSIGDGSHRRFSTAAALMAFHEANGDGRYKTLIANGAKYLKSLQQRESPGDDAANLFAGGTSFDPDSPPNLLDTALAVEVLHDVGQLGDDEYLQRTLAFMLRCQNFPGAPDRLTETGDGTDGGFADRPTDRTQATERHKHGRTGRSNGIATCAGLKCLLDAGLGRDDPRVEVATTWIRRNYTLARNPGASRPQESLYYYYYRLARTLNRLGEERFADAQGVRHDWRRELGDLLTITQLPDGTWINPAASRSSQEAHTPVVSVYAMLVLTQLKSPADVADLPQTTAAVTPCRDK